MARKLPPGYFFILWVIATLAGFVLPVYASLDLPLFDLRHCMFHGSLLLGLLQWLVLRQNLRPAVWWIPVTAIGGFICLWLGYVLSTMMLFAAFLPLSLRVGIGFAVSGALVGCGQFFVLRKYRRARWLIAVTALTASLSLSQFLLIQVLNSPLFFDNVSIPSGSEWLWAAIVGGALAGIVQGAGLLWVLQQEQQKAIA